MEWRTASGTNQAASVSWERRRSNDDDDDWERGRRPDARDDKAETDEETPIRIDLLNNDRYAVGVFRIEGEYVRPGDTVTLDSGAQVTLSESGKVIYDPSSSEKLDLLNDYEMALDSFSYSVFGKKGFDNATVHVSVNGVTDDPGGNQPPVAKNDVVVIPNDPFPDPYPKPVPLPLAETNSSQSAMATEIQPTPVEGPIVTTLAIGEEGDPNPLPDSVDIFPLSNDVDPDGDPMTIGTINGNMVEPGDVVTLRSGAKLEVSDDGTHLTYSGGLLDENPSVLIATEDVVSLIETGGGEALVEPTELPEPLPIPLPRPILADVFTYQASDGEYLSDEASVAVVRGYPFDPLVSNDDLIV